MSVMAHPQPPLDWANTWFLTEEEQNLLKRQHRLTENDALNANSQNLPQISPATLLPSVSNKDPLTITLQDGESPLKRSIKGGSMKDPQTGLTMDTVKRRKLCHRFDELHRKHGVWYRLQGFPRLTNIQVAALLRRCRNRPEMVDVSDTIWDHVYEDKRKLDDRLNNDKNLTKEFFRDMRQMKQQEDEHEATDVSDEEDDFELIDSLFDDDDVLETFNRKHKSWEKVQRYHEIRRSLIQTDHWLCLMNRTLLERKSKMRLFYEKNQRTHTSFLLHAKSIEGNNECARCIPINKNHRRKFVKYDAPAAFPVDRLHPVGLVEDVLLMDEEMNRVLEEISIGFQCDDPAIISKIPAHHKERILMIKDRKNVRPKEHGEETDNFKSSSGSGSSTKKSSCKLRPDREPQSNLLTMAANLENVLERKNLEEQLHRQSSGYVYSEITVPQFRAFNLDEHEERATEKLPRKSSNDSLKESTRRQPKFVFRIEKNEALYFAAIHHSIEFKKYSEEEVRTRWRERWLYTAEYVPYDPLYYKHEDPRSAEFKFCAYNPHVPPFPPLFPPCLSSSACRFIHYEPRMIAPCKFEGTKGSDHSRNPLSLELPCAEQSTLII